MSENTYKPRNYRVVRHVTKNRILDIQDALEIDKLRIELVDFAEGEGARLAVEHYAEPDALALVCYDILQGRPWEKYVEFKGSVQGDTVTSRVLAVERVEARNPIKITVSRGPGKVAGQGAIQPLGKPEATLSVLLSEFDARRIALTLLRHMAAYEAATYHARVAAGTRRPTSEAEEGAGRAERGAEAPGMQSPRGQQQAAPRQEAHRDDQEASREESGEPKTPEVEPAMAAATAPATPVRRTPARPVETYWMAAERLGVPRAEAERIVQEAEGDWGKAWATLRSRGERQPAAG